MPEAAACTHAHLEPVPSIAEPIAPRRRELAATLPRDTVTAALRRSLAIAALIVVGACGGAKQSDTHARATDLQGACCEHLQGGGRDTCLAQIPRVDDPQIAHHTTSQRTFGCVAEHFVCNPATGRPTQASAQAQLECIQDQE